MMAPYAHHNVALTRGVALSGAPDGLNRNFAAILCVWLAPCGARENVVSTAGGPSCREATREEAEAAVANYKCDTAGGALRPAA